MTTPNISATGASTQIINNTSNSTQRWNIACNTSCVLASQSSVSATSGLALNAGSTVEMIVPAGGGVWSFGASATEVTTQLVG